MWSIFPPCFVLKEKSVLPASEISNSIFYQSHGMDKIIAQSVIRRSTDVKLSFFRISKASGPMLQTRFA
jgi:hypothetical protein